METYEKFKRGAIENYPQPSLRPLGAFREGPESMNCSAELPAKCGHTIHAEILVSVQSSYPSTGDKS
jgi:hypothetical protein